MRRKQSLPIFLMTEFTGETKVPELFQEWAGGVKNHMSRSVLRRFHSARQRLIHTKMVSYHMLEHSKAPVETTLSKRREGENHYPSARGIC